MLSVLVVVLPIFALILAGWTSRRLGVLGPHATGELNRFVVWLALPALLFDIVANAHWSDLWRPGFAAAFGLGAAIVFVLPLGWAAWTRRGRSPRHLADSAIDALNVAYPNTGFVGFPLAAGAFGAAALAPTLIATILTVCWVFAAALVLIEIALRPPEKSGAAAAVTVARSLATNPLLVAPAVGLAVMAAGVAMPEPVERFLKLLGAAASPCALVALGLFLGEKQAGAKPAGGAVAAMVALKLVAQPAVTWLLATQVFHLQPMETHVAVLMAALPTGTGPFMLAEFYRREAGVTSRVILVSTLLAVATITVYLGLVV